MLGGIVCTILFMVCLNIKSLSDKQSTSGAAITYHPSTWTQSSVRDLFSPVFNFIELHVAGVGPPNNVRIITSPPVTDSRHGRRVLADLSTAGRSHSEREETAVVLVTGGSV
jgi:hypothetical protein